MKTGLRLVALLWMLVTRPAIAAEPAWQDLIAQGDSYELRGRNIICPIGEVDLNGDQLQVSYSCDGPEGKRFGHFHGRQSGPNSFTGKYLLRTSFSYLGGSMRLKFISGRKVLVTAHGERMTLRLRAR